MKKGVNLLLVFLLLASASCSDHSARTDLPIGDPKESPAINSGKEFSDLKMEEELDNLKQIKHQIDAGNFTQIEELVRQVNSQLSEDSIQMNAEEKLSFPQPSKRILADFFTSINLESLKANKEFKKKYSMNSAPKGFKPDSKECPDELTLGFDETTLEFTLSIDNRFLVDPEIGCAESTTVYYLTTEKIN